MTRTTAPQMKPAANMSASCTFYPKNSYTVLTGIRENGINTHQHGDTDMANAALNRTYNEMYAQLEAWQAAGEQVCADWYASFSEIAARDYSENRALYA